jgi:hypothetical protein
MVLVDPGATPAESRSNEMTNDPTAATSPIACDLSDAPDTAEERMAEYRRLFAQSLAGRERIDEGVRLRLRADNGVEAWVRDLAVREKACCPFYNFAVTVAGGEVWWDISLVDGVAADDEDTARTMLEEFYNAPDNLAGGVDGMKQRLADSGFAVTANESGTVMRFHRTGADA